MHHLHQQQDDQQQDDQPISARDHYLFKSFVGNQHFQKSDINFTSLTFCSMSVK